MDNVYIKKSYRPRVRVRGNSDSKNTKKKLIKKSYQPRLRGSCQICTSAQNCTKRLLHKEIILHKDKIARSQFCTKTLLHKQTILHRDISWVELFYFFKFYYHFFFTFTVTPNPYPQFVSFLFFIIFFFYLSL